MTAFDPAPRSPSRFPLVILCLLLGGVAGAALLGLLARTARHGVWEQLASYATGRTRIDAAPLPAVVDKIRQLQRLETVVYTMDKIVEGDRQSLILPDFLAGDRLLLVAHGEVIAGIDLSQLGPGSIRIEGRRIAVHLPDAQIFSSRLDGARTRVYSRTTGLFVSADPNLESEVRQKAEEQFRQAAQADGIVDRARQNARATVKTMLLGLGFESVEVN